MLVAVALWTAASVSHAFMGGVAGFGAARALLGLGEGATFPGGLRTAVESLPVEKRARGIATSFSGGTIGAIMTPLTIVPVALAYGWRTAFLLTGVLVRKPSNDDRSFNRLPSGCRSQAFHF